MKYAWGISKGRDANQLIARGGFLMTHSFLSCYLHEILPKRANVRAVGKISFQDANAESSDKEKKDTCRFEGLRI